MSKAEWFSSEPLEDHLFAIQALELRIAKEIRPHLELYLSFHGSWDKPGEQMSPDALARKEKARRAFRTQFEPNFVIEKLFTDAASRHAMQDVSSIPVAVCQGLVEFFSSKIPHENLQWLPVVRYFEAIQARARDS